MSAFLLQCPGAHAFAFGLRFPIKTDPVRANHSRFTDKEIIIASIYEVNFGEVDQQKHTFASDPKVNRKKCPSGSFVPFTQT
jgi:hypothetical protein